MAKFELKYLFLSHGIIAFLFGTGFIILPSLIAPLMGFSLGDDGIALMRVCGSMILGIGIIAFGVRKEPHSALRQQIILAFIVLYTILDIIKFLYFDLTNWMIWFLIVMRLSAP